MTVFSAIDRLPLTPRIATLALAVSSVFFGLVPLLARELQAAGMVPAAIAFFRFAFTGAVVLPFLPLDRGRWRETTLMTAAGICLGLSWVGYLSAIETVPVAAAGVIYMSYPAFALIFAWLLLGQAPGKRAWLACGLVGGASVLVFSDGLDAAASWTLLWSAPTPVFFGLLIVVISAMTPSLSSLEKLACGMVGSVLGLAPVALLTDPQAFFPATPETWLTVLVLGAVTALVPQLIYTVACRHVGPARAAIAGAVELPTMIAIGFFFFAEALGVREAMAVGLVIAAVALAPAVSAAPETPESAPRTRKPHPAR